MPPMCPAPSNTLTCREDKDKESDLSPSTKKCASVLDDGNFDGLSSIWQDRNVCESMDTAEREHSASQS